MRSIDLLKQLAMEADRRKYPNIPDRARVAPRFDDTGANGITKAILIWLELNGHKAWRQSSEGRYRPGKQYVDVIGRVRQMKGQYIPGTNRGHGDVASIIDGLFVSWEVKMNDKQSNGQRRFQKEVEASGGRYFIVVSFDEFMRHYKTLAGDDKTPT